MNVSKEDYNHVDVIDVSENRLDGYVIDNLSILIQMILTGGDQCPCGKVREIHRSYRLPIESIRKKYYESVDRVL